MNDLPFFPPTAEVFKSSSGEGRATPTSLEWHQLTPGTWSQTHYPLCVCPARQEQPGQESKQHLGSLRGESCRLTQALGGGARFLP